MDTLRRASAITIIAGGVIACGAAFAGEPRWGLGIFAGAAWMTLNFFLLVEVIRIAVLKKTKAQLTALLLVKFPLLYLLLLFIMSLRAFPVLSMLAGMPLIFIVVGATRYARIGRRTA